MITSTITCDRCEAATSPVTMISNEVVTPSGWYRVFSRHQTGPYLMDWDEYGPWHLCPECGANRWPEGGEQ